MLSLHTLLLAASSFCLKTEKSSCFEPPRHTIWKASDHCIVIMIRLYEMWRLYSFSPLHLHLISNAVEAYAVFFSNNIS